VVLGSDVARPLSYKTKTTYFFKMKTKTIFSRPRSLFVKAIKLLTQDHWRSQKFRLGGVQIRKNFCDVILVTFLRDVMVMTSRKRRHNYILMFDLFIISFKNHHLAKSQNFKSPILKIKRRWDRNAPALCDFRKFVTKIVHFRHISAKI